MKHLEQTGEVRESRRQAGAQQVRAVQLDRHAAARVVRTRVCGGARAAGPAEREPLIEFARRLPHLYERCEWATNGGKFYGTLGI